MRTHEWYEESVQNTYSMMSGVFASHGSCRLVFIVSIHSFCVSCLSFLRTTGSLAPSLLPPFPASLLSPHEPQTRISSAFRRQSKPFSYWRV